MPSKTTRRGAGEGPRVGLHASWPRPQPRLCRTPTPGTKTRAAPLQRRFFARPSRGLLLRSSSSLPLSAASALQLWTRVSEKVTRTPTPCPSPPWCANGPRASRPEIYRQIFRPAEDKLNRWRSSELEGQPGRSRSPRRGWVGRYGDDRGRSFSRPKHSLRESPEGLAGIAEGEKRSVFCQLSPRQEKK